MMNSWDNAGSGALFGSLKVERLHGMRFETRRRARDEGIDCLVWCNCRKLYSTLGYTGPMQYEQRSLVGQPKTAKV
jgi:transposase InsO family protein